MSLKLFISAFPAAIFGWIIWENVTMLTENERLRHKNHTLNNILDIKEKLRCHGDKELIDEVEKIIDFHKNPESWVVIN